MDRAEGVTHSIRDGSPDLRKILVFGALVSAVLIVSVFNPYLGIVSLALLLASFIIGANLPAAVLCLIFLMPFDPQVELRPGFYLYFDLLFALPAPIYLWHVMFGKFRIRWASLVLAPYLLFAISTTFWRAENLFWFSAYSVRLAIAILFMGVIADLVPSDTITLVLGVTLVPQVLYGAYQFLIRDVGSLYYLIYPHYPSPWLDRAYGFFFQPNNFGGYCAVVSIMLLALGLRSVARRRRTICYSLAALGAVGLASSGSRGAWLGAFAGLVVLFMFSNASLGMKLTLATVTGLGILIVKSLEYAPIMRAETLDATTLEGRSLMYLAALLLFIQHPFVGVGLTNYQELLPSTVMWEYGTGNVAHNLYLQILSENGAIGFLLFLGPVFYFFYKNLKAAKLSDTALISAAGLAVFLVHGMFDFQFTTAPQYLLLFAILFGLAAKCINLSAHYSAAGL